VTGRRASERDHSIVAGLLLTLFVLQAAIAAMRDSVTIDEFVGVPVGLYTLQAVDFRSESMNPPFFRSFAALPLLFQGPPAPRIAPMNEINDWAMGYRFMEEYADTYHALFVPARCMVIFIAVLLGALVFRWGVNLYGPTAGVIALLLFAFSPTILANGHLVTLDMAGALGWFSVSYLTWRFLAETTFSRAITLGAVLGLSMVLKLSGVILPAVVAMLVLIMAFSERLHGRRLAQLLGLLAIAQLLALAVLNGLYRFEGFAERLRDVDFDSQRMLHLATAFPRLRLPLPVPFLKSLDVLFVGDQPNEPLYFLAGQWSLHGWWYYHLAAFALKAPLPLILSGAFAICAWTSGRSHGIRDYCVFVPALAVFAANSILNPLNIGVRHALPVFPLLALGASRWLSLPIDRLLGGTRTPANVAAAAVSVSLLIWFGTASATIAPRYLQYFNELAGGSENGHRWLVDSNIDWGQDLVRLAEYMRQKNLPSVHLAYFGRVDPTVYGIHYTPLVEGNSHGPAVVSASFLMGRPYWIWRKPGELDWAHFREFAWLQSLHPVARIGSMFLFDLP
jgi:Dolichyl-phosphate-mannose-protein mannosyltransferase